MNPAEELAYTRGQRMAMRKLLGMAMREFAAQEANPCAENVEPDWLLRAVGLRAQLEDTRAALRSICAAHGNNDWSDSLNLADVVNKHLAWYLDDAAEQKRIAYASRFQTKGHKPADYYGDSEWDAHEGENPD